VSKKDKFLIENDHLTKISGIDQNLTTVFVIDFFVNMLIFILVVM